MREWSEFNFSEFAEFSYGKMPKKELLGKGKYPTFSGYKYQYKYPEANCDSGDLIIVARGVGGTGDVKLVKEKCYLTNLSIKAKIDRNIASETFLYYFFSTNGLSYLDSGSAQSQITIADLIKESFVLPSIEEQNVISEILLSFDNKIELLRLQNDTIEALADCIFRNIFIEKIRDDWEVKPLDEIAHYLNGLACQKYPPINQADKLPVLKIKELRSGSVFGPDCDWASTNVPKEYFVNSGDVIFSWSASLLVKIWDGEQAILNQHLFKVTSDKYPKWFIYLWTKHHLDKFISIAETKATTMGHIKRADLSSSMAVVPDEKSLERIDSEISPLIEKIEVNNRSIRHISKIRDDLLPRLMSGEVRVQYEVAV